jgi:hypothetical protein
VWLWAAAAWAVPKWHGAVAPGVDLVVALGRTERSRVGAGLVVGWQRQRWMEVGRYVRGGDYRVWADERWDANLGPVARVWWVDGAWASSVGARFGVQHPLRVGLLTGWVAGPGAAAELSLAMSTAGWWGLDGVVSLEGPYARAAAGATLGVRGVDGTRTLVGVGGPLTRVENWDGGDWTGPGG